MFTYLRGIDKDVDARVILAVEAVLIVNGLDVPDALAESCFEVDLVYGGGRRAARRVCVTQDLELPDAKSPRALNARGKQLARAAIKRVRSAHSLQRACVLCSPGSHIAGQPRRADAARG
jgi:hypothetical protein